MFFFLIERFNVIFITKFYTVKDKIIIRYPLYFYAQIDTNVTALELTEKRRIYNDEYVISFYI